MKIITFFNAYILPSDLRYTLYTDEYAPEPTSLLYYLACFEYQNFVVYFPLIINVKT